MVTIHGVDRSRATRNIWLAEEAALDAVTKYPWYRGPGGGKCGFYADDRPAATWARAESRSASSGGACGAPR